MSPVTPSALGRRYAPFLAVAAVQVLLVAIAPSKEGAETGVVSTGRGTGQGAQFGSDGVNGATGTTDVGTGGVAGGAAGAPGTAGAAGRGAAGSAATGAGGRAGAAAGTVEDLSRCAPDGRQIGPTYYMPLCKPVFKGDNGGPAMTGTTGDEIRYVYYVSKSDPQVDALLATQNLAATRQDACLAREAFNKALNKRYELSGRKFVSLDGPGNHKGSAQQDCKFPYYQGQCTLTPPDPPCQRAEAAEIASMKPAYVIAATANNSFYNELGKRGIVSAGGQLAPASYHTDVAPHYWDVFMDGTRAARFMAEYWCKRLAGRQVRWGGPSVMDPDRTSATPPPRRKLGVVYPSTSGDPTFKLSVEDVFVRLVTSGNCGDATGSVEVYPYESDINKAQQQSFTITSSMKSRGVTSVICFCDPIAPVFMTSSMDQQDYEPEHVLSGTGLIDYDLLGRLYSPRQWQHAFGLSHIPLQSQFEQSDAAKAWRDAGNPGSPGDRTSNLSWAYHSLMGASFHYAGPRPTPENLRNGLWSAAPRGGWKESKGNPHYALIKFGLSADDYTGIKDVREVWWSNSRPSEIDGRPGSYAMVEGGRRYELGEFPTTDPKVFE